MSETIIPEGYLQNAQGHLVPVEQISEYDQARDELVRDLIDQARKVRHVLTTFKDRAIDDVDAFVDLSAERYDAKVGGSKGNLTLTSFDGQFQVVVQVADRLVFDERIQAAKKIVDECILKWSESASGEIKALVQHAFQTDKTGKLSTSRILALTHLDIVDDRWAQGMQAIKDSMTVASSCRYIRFYERDERGRYKKMTLDIASA